MGKGRERNSCVGERMSACGEGEVYDGEENGREFGEKKREKDGCTSMVASIN